LNLVLVTWALAEAFYTDLAWLGISTQLGRVARVWWDQGETCDELDAFERVHAFRHYFLPCITNGLL